MYVGSLPHRSLVFYCCCAVSVNISLVSTHWPAASELMSSLRLEDRGFQLTSRMT